MSISVVQTAQGSIASGSSVTVTFGANVTPGNCVIVAIYEHAGGSNPQISGITLGGHADNFAQLVEGGNTLNNLPCFIWADPDCIGGSPTVVVSLSVAASTDCSVFCWEASGVRDANILDQSGTSNSVGSGGSTGTLAVNGELVIAISSVTSGATGLSGPGSPWTNQAVIHTSDWAVAGYEVRPNTGAQSYTPTVTGGGLGGGCIVALLPAKTAQASLTATATGSATALVRNPQITVVQSAEAEIDASGGPSTVSFPSHVTAGNCVVVAIFSPFRAPGGGTATVTLNGSPDNFAQLAEQSYGPFTDNLGSAIAYCWMWADPDCAGGTANVIVDWTGNADFTGGAVYMWEVTGLLHANVLDVQTGATGPGSSESAPPSSGPVATNYANEFWAGIAVMERGFGGPFTNIGPTAPWVTMTEGNNGIGYYSVAGYQIVALQGEAQFTGSWSPDASCLCLAIVVALAGKQGTGKLNAAAGITAQAFVLGPRSFYKQGVTQLGGFATVAPLATSPPPGTPAG